jgi:SAM-dependent methyltransferase
MIDEQSEALRRATGSAFEDPDVATAYLHRPPYPEELFLRLAALLPNDSRLVLDLGCGPGDLARRLVPLADAVHAVDPSQAMVDLGKRLPGGNSANMEWFCQKAEDFDYPATYGLVVAGESFHWMTWSTVIPKIAASLAAGGQLALVGRVERAPWDKEFSAIIPHYSTAANYRPVDPAAEMTAAGLFEVTGRFETTPQTYRQSVDSYIELQHSRGAFARYRMGESRAASFGASVRRLVEPYAVAGVIEYEFAATVVYGRPGRSSVDEARSGR